MEGPEINAYIHCQLIFDKDAKKIHWGEKQSKKWCWNKWISTFKAGELDPYFTLYYKINSTWIKTLNVKAKAVKLLEENKVNHRAPGLCSSFLDMIL